MFSHYRSKGLILKEERRGESDLLFTIYAKDFGKLEILGKSIRKIDSKLRSGANVLYLSDIEFIQGRRFKTLTDAILIKRFERVRNDLRGGLSAAYKISEVLDNLIKGQEPDLKIWHIVLEVFEALEKRYSEIIYYYFFWNFVSALGYTPRLRYCAICQTKLVPEGLSFNSRKNGVICQNCAKNSELLDKISPETVKILRFASNNSLKNLIKLKIEDDYLSELKSVSDNYYSYLCANYS